MENVERLLPNGFHDGILHRMVVDYDGGVLSLEIAFWIGDMENERREIYRLGRVTVSGLAFLIIDNPNQRQSPLNGELVIDGGPGQPSTSPVSLPAMPPGTFLYWIFVDPWNSFIRFAAAEASLEWLGEEVDRGGA